MEVLWLSHTAHPSWVGVRTSCIRAVNQTFLAVQEYGYVSSLFLRYLRWRRQNEAGQLVHVVAVMACDTSDHWAIHDVQTNVRKYHTDKVSVNVLMWGLLTLTLFFNRITYRCDRISGENVYTARRNIQCNLWIYRFTPSPHISYDWDGRSYDNDESNHSEAVSRTGDSLHV